MITFNIIDGVYRPGLMDLINNQDRSSICKSILTNHPAACQRAANRAGADLEADIITLAQLQDYSYQGDVNGLAGLPLFERYIHEECFGM